MNKKVIKAWVAIREDGSILLDKASNTPAIYFDEVTPTIDKIAAIFNITMVPCTITYSLPSH